MDPIFLDPNRVDGGWNMGNAYSLGTMLRALEYPTAAAMNAWKAAAGFSSYQREMTDWPPPYVTAYHQDGLVLGLSGLRNYGQFATVFNNAAAVSMYGVPGKVQQSLRLAWEAIQADIFSKIIAAPSNERIVIAGHSFGGALACLAAYKIATRFGTEKLKYVIVFGSPKPGTQEFADGMPVPLLSCENMNDWICRWPYYGGRLSQALRLGMFHGFVMPGVPLEFPERGSPYFERTFRYRLPDVPLAVNTVLSWGEDPTGDVHKMRTYLSRLQYFSGARASAGPREEMLNRLNKALDLGVTPADFVTPLDPPVTTAVTTPDLPTTARLQSIPSNAGAPGDPTPTLDTRFVGENTRTASVETVATATRADSVGRFKGPDGELIHAALFNMGRVASQDAIVVGSPATVRAREASRRRVIGGLKIALTRIAERDARNATGSASRARSTSRYVIDPADTVITAAFAAVRARCEEYLTDSETNVLFVPGPQPFAGQFARLSVHLRGQLHFVDKLAPVD